MLELLLDEHVLPDVADGLRRRNRALAVHCMSEWEGGEFLGQDDFSILQEASTQRLTLVTYDLRTIPVLLKTWAEEGRPNGGVIFVDGKTISPADIGGLVRALTDLYKGMGKLDWTDRVCFLQR